MNRKILFVDDDTNILSGYKRALRKEFEIKTAEGGAEAIAIIESSDEFAVISSDMRMPKMDGIEFLKRVKDANPDSIRIMLTGNADERTAMDAVNEGSIFRFLTKPCKPETLAKVLESGIEQYRLVMAEKELLNQTLNKSLQVLVEILSMVNPTAFSRASRIRSLATELAKEYKLEKPWEIEIAAMLSQLGCLTVPEETLIKLSKAEPLSGEEMNLYHQHPKLGHDLIAKIPRMNSIAHMVAKQTSRVNDKIDSSKELNGVESVELGSRILKVVTDFDRCLETGDTYQSAFEKLIERQGIYDFGVLSKLKLIVDKAAKKFLVMEIPIYLLEPGMMVGESVYTSKNMLLLKKGQHITDPLIISLNSFAERGAIPSKIKISIPEKNTPKIAEDEIKTLVIPKENMNLNQAI